MWEKLMRELEEERGLRLDSKKRLREVTEESELSPVQMVSLQQHFSRVEETVRTLLQNQGALEHSAMDTVDLMKAYKDKLSEEVRKQQESLQEAGQPAEEAESQSNGGCAEEDRDKETKVLLERLRALEAENSALAMENVNQREQYERCLDEVANQVVQALLTQKDLREECLKLRTRVFDLEQQNRTLSILFQQRVRPASDLLLQKLQSRIKGLSAGDLILEPERSKNVLLSRNTDSPPQDVQLNGKASLPVGKFPSQLSLTVPAGAYPRSSCSSSELSLSSACSEYSSGSYTWNEGRSSNKLSSLNWEKRMSLGSSAPSNICAPPEEQLPARRKECHILEGLRRLQRRKHREPSAVVSKSAYKDCMNSNEGIYSLGIKCGNQGGPKPSTTGKSAGQWMCGKRFAYDSDDADDELTHPCNMDRWELTRRASDGLPGKEEELGNGAAKHSSVTGYDSKERPEKLTSFLSSFLSSSARSTMGSSLLPCKVSPMEDDSTLPHHSDLDELDLRVDDDIGRLAERPEKDPRRLSREADKPSVLKGLRREHSRAQSADSRPRPLSLIDQFRGSKNAQSEECIAVIFDAEDGEPIELSSQPAVDVARNEIPRRRPQSASMADYSQLGPQGKHHSHKGSSVRNYTVLQSPERPAELQSPGTRRKNTPPQSEGSQQQKLIKPAHHRALKVHSVPPMNGASSPKANFTKIPGRGKGSPLKVPPDGSASLAPPTQDRSPSSPPVKLSKVARPPGGGYSAQSPKAVHLGSKLPCRTEFGKGPTSGIPGSPLLARRHLEHMDFGEQPTHDVGQQIELRSPSPPPPPGRSTSLLIRPNYDSTPQALKPGVHTPTPSTVRGAPPGSQTHPHAPSSMVNTQHSASHKSQDTAPWDSICGAEEMPQRLVDSAGHHLQKSPASCRTPMKGSPKRVSAKLHPSLASGHTQDLHDSVSKGPKNAPQKGFSLQSTPSGKKGQPPENEYPILYKTSGSLPISLQGHSPGVTGSLGSALQPPQVTPNSTTIGISPQNSAERGTKTRIPIGLKALVKSPASLRESSTLPEHHEKDHVDAPSQGSAMVNSFNLREVPQKMFGFEAAPRRSKVDTKNETRCNSMDGQLLPPVVIENGAVCDELDGEGRLFKRSISVTNKPHLKPALGMNGAKARSQSFSTHYMQRPCISTSDGPGKVRTHIITNTGERGSSLTRQSSLGDGFQTKSTGGSRETLPLSSGTRQFPHGGMSGSNSNHGLPVKATPRAGPQKEVHSLPLSDRINLKSSRQPAKVASHPQFNTTSFPLFSPDLPAEGMGNRLLNTNKLDLSVSQQTSSSTGPEEPEKLLSHSASTIEEKVMMGIQENVERGQAQNKSQTSESKHKTGSSLANWFGFRKSKLPSLGGKKTDSPKGKEEKKELKIGSVLGGKQTKPDKMKDKKKNELQRKDSREQMVTENMDKQGLRMDHCNIDMGQLTNQMQRSTSYMGKDQFMKEILIRSVTKDDSHGAPLPGNPIAPQGIPSEKRGMKADIEIHVDSKTKTVTQKINLRAEKEVDLEPEPNCQDHVIGSSSQTRTLDSGIGTFPLPDSVTRVTGRHLPKSTSSPGHPLCAPAEPAKDLPATSPSEPKVPFLSKNSQNVPCSTGLTFSNPTVTLNNMCDPESHLQKPAASGVMKAKRLSQSDSKTDPAHSPEDGKRKNNNHSPLNDRVLRVCTYSGSSSENESDPEYEATATRLGHDTLLSKTRNRKQVDQEEEEMKGSVGNHLSIMDYYQQEVLVHNGKEEHRNSTQYNSADTEGKSHKKNELDKTTGDEKSLGFPGVSLESLNKLNSNGGPFPEGEQKTAVGKATEKKGERQTDEPSSSCSDKPEVDNQGSLSDSLYDSFSSCTSQGSNEV
ncbi:nck-associated protein 5-like [Megalops cyprinoides]|uniref:nck-associated protein 5-like n=1 Tax=Megalops cyprinoides TaxID=118141 RepID=UPI001865456B|nr:nck-associated protein 5-like [Megalops cyprinoides]